jgi:hypothetical protein
MFAAAQEPRLVRITPAVEGQAMGLWLLHHPDVRGNARVRLLTKWLGDAVPVELAQQAAGGKVWPCFADCPLATKRRRRVVGAPGEAPGS